MNSISFLDLKLPRMDDSSESFNRIQFQSFLFISASFVVARKVMKFHRRDGDQPLKAVFASSSHRKVVVMDEFVPVSGVQTGMGSLFQHRDNIFLDSFLGDCFAYVCNCMEQTRKQVMSLGVSDIRAICSMNVNISLKLTWNFELVYGKEQVQSVSRLGSKVIERYTSRTMIQQNFIDVIESQTRNQEMIKIVTVIGVIIVVSYGLLVIITFKRESSGEGMAVILDVVQEIEQRRRNSCGMDNVK
ncbi:hypothetical protein C0J52_12981 [Blattella germanica]|nr:hypothetical protein C0J52_12981 [Blattella germanica]